MPPYIPKDTVALLAKIPAIPVRRAYLAELHRRLKTLLDRSSRARLLSILKYAAYIVLFLNFGSLPFIWHIRVFWPILLANIKYRMLRLKLVFASRKERSRALIAWAEKRSQVGANPFKVTTVYRQWATIDDIDMLMHLSNSSYAKTLDSARVKAFVEWFFTWGHSGGQVALGATHYHFLREIAPLVRYEIRLTIGAWDHKWLYVVARFVSHSGGRRHGGDRSPESSVPPTPHSARALQNGSGSADVERVIAAIIREGDGTGRTTLLRAPIVAEPDGATLHCVAVSQLCFKLGRITVPPAVVLASEGFTKPFSDGDGGNVAFPGVRVYSHANPPPNWIKSRSLRAPPYGSKDGFLAFLQGKWRDAPEGERWWEDALSGSIETKRRANLETLESLRLGMERTRTLR